MNGVISTRLPFFCSLWFQLLTLFMSYCESWLKSDKNALPVATIPAVQLKPAHQTSSIRLTALKCLPKNIFLAGWHRATPPISPAELLPLEPLSYSPTPSSQNHC